MVSTNGWGVPHSATSLKSRFFLDSGLWKNAPLLKGSTSFEPLPDIKNIMVTGGEGFVGSWLVRHLVDTYPDHYNVVSFDKLDYCSSLNNARMLEKRKNFHFFCGDVTNAADVEACLEEHKIDTIFHLAAQSHVDLSFGNSFRFTINNVGGTHVMLETVKDFGIKRFIHVSTDEVYGEVLEGGADLAEHGTLDPSNPYAASKAAAEQYVSAYAKSFKIPSIIVRLNNMYGPHQYPEKIIPKFINLLFRQRKLIIHGDGQNSRRYLYAGDAADAFDTILHKGEIGHTYNVDSRDEIQNIDLAKTLLGSFGHDTRDSKQTNSQIEYVQDRPFNDKRYAVDGSKLRELGWAQRTSFEEGLRATVDWYREFGDWWGDISGVLKAYPTVDRDEVIGSDKVDAIVAADIRALKSALANEVAKLGQAETETTMGAVDHSHKVVGTSNSATNGSMECDMYKVVKKRKAELMG